MSATYGPADAARDLVGIEARIAAKEAAGIADDYLPKLIACRDELRAIVAEGGACRPVRGGA